MESIDAMIYLMESVKQSLKVYEREAKKREGSPLVGYDLGIEDGKYSIQRRIRVIREELLKLSKSL